MASSPLLPIADLPLTEPRFYLDENVPLEVASQLQLSGIDVVSARSLNRLGDEDSDHLHRATGLGRVLCTHDQDFLQLAAEGHSHAGIAFGPQVRASVGGWVRAFRGLHATETLADGTNRVFFLGLR